MNSRTRRGFSLAQVFVTVAIVAVVASASIGAIGKVQDNGRERLAIARGMRLRAALEAYYDRTGGAPTSWATESDDQRFAQLQPFLPLTSPTLAAYTPEGFTVSLPPVLPGVPVITRTSPHATLNFETGRFTQ